jgi:hypothetical protein
MVAAAAASTFDAQTAQRVDALEGEILRTARARRVGSGGVPSYGVGPSFRPYSGR